MEPMSEETEISASDQTDDTIDLEEENKLQVVIRPIHFIILSIASFGLYNVWWMYKCWRYFKYKEQLDIYPAMRAFFSLFFGYQLFSKISNYSAAKGYDARYDSSVVLIAFFLINLLSRLPKPFWILSSFSFIPLLYPLRAFNFYFTGDADASESSFNDRKFFVASLGAICWVLVIAGLVLNPKH